MNFFDYLGWMLPAVVIGNGINYFFLCTFYRKELTMTFDTHPGSKTPRP